VVEVFDRARAKVAPPEPVRPDTFGAFIEAVKAGDFPSSQRLLREEPTLVNWADDQFGATALHWSALRGHEAIVALLLGQGANPSSPNKDGETPLQVAQRGDHKGVVRLLKQVESPIFEAVRQGDLAEVRRLLQLDPTLLDRPDVEFGATPLHWAALRGHAAVVSFLLTSGANAERRNAQGETPLEVARRQGNAQVATLLQGATPGN
jgi:cytohesin